MVICPCVSSRTLGMLAKDPVSELGLSSDLYAAKDSATCVG